MAAIAAAGKAAARETARADSAPEEAAEVVANTSPAPSRTTVAMARTAAGAVAASMSGGGTGARGGFGGGGGASGFAGTFGEDGGNGGFGGGGGAGHYGMITDGNPGNGGFFGGNGRSEAGGGGAGLGGAIFNDSGIVVITNSTFTANSAVGGSSLGGAPEGRGGGGAIFSRNGQLTVLNATINGNSSVIGLGGGIMVAQEESAPTLFVLKNTIVANNGEAECAVTGSSIAGAFAGNLITQNAIGQIMREKTFVACPGVVTTADPQLAPLALNNGPTPTMAIAVSSPAWNTADFGTSLGFDQRGQRRPALGGVDIGAFELCLQNIFDAQLPCVIAGFEESPGGGEPLQLTIEVDPPGGGTTVPAEGTISVAPSSPVALTATPNPGYRFTGGARTSRIRRTRQP